MGETNKPEKFLKKSNRQVPYDPERYKLASNVFMKTTDGPVTIT